MYHFHKLRIERTTTWNLRASKAQVKWPGLSIRRNMHAFRLLLSLSKKSKWPTLIILASLKINNLQATENGKMPRIKVFRQARYLTYKLFYNSFLSSLICLRLKSRPFEGFPNQEIVQANTEYLIAIATIMPSKFKLKPYKNRALRLFVSSICSIMYILQSDNLHYR